MRIAKRLPTPVLFRKWTARAVITARAGGVFALPPILMKLFGTLEAAEFIFPIAAFLRGDITALSHSRSIPVFRPGRIRGRTACAGPTPSRTA
jgi:hypothetical protein